MGLLKHLLFWPVTGPKFLTEFALGQVEGVVRERLTDDSEVKSELLELQMRLELGEIDDDEYAAGEAALMQRLREVREWRERFGMGVSGGLVRVAGSALGEVDAESEATVLGEEPERPAVEPPAPRPAQEEEAPPETPAQEGPLVADPGSASIEINLDWD